MSNYKRIFLDGYSYYLTIVTHQRNPILLENIALLRESFRVSKSKYDYDINDIIILPDHFHMIITPKISTQYPQIIRTIKYHFSKHLDERYYVHLKQSFSRTRRGSKPIWQKRYYEHTIRDEKDYMEKITYMYQNPVKHKYVTDAKQWEYSSFQK
jgi:putative transposase